MQAGQDAAPVVRHFRQREHSAQIALDDRTAAGDVIASELRRRRRGMHAKIDEPLRQIAHFVTRRHARPQIEVFTGFERGIVAAEVIADRSRRKTTDE